MNEIDPMLKSIFGSSRAGEMQRKRRGTLKITSKLPTSLDELKALTEKPKLNVKPTADHKH